jgi:penicillin-binding protein 1C
MLKTIKNHPRKILAISFLLLLFYWFSLPKPLFQMPTCMVLEDQKGNLLGARIAADGQWRFPHQTAVPDKFAAAIIEFEDRRFYNHSSNAAKL